MVGNLNVSFQNMLPLHKVVRVEAKVDSAEKLKMMVHGRTYGEKKTTYAVGECLCITSFAQTYCYQIG